MRSSIVPIVTSILVACTPGSVPPDPEVLSATSALEGREWAAEVEPTEEEPALEPTAATLWLPDGVESPRGVVVFSRHARGIDMFESEGWRLAAATESLALVEMDLRGHDGTQEVTRFADQGARQVQHVLEALADASGLPEVAERDLLLWGHSSGGMVVTALVSQMPERVAGYIPWHGSIEHTFLDPQRPLYADLSRPEFLEVPALVVLGDRDAPGIVDSTLSWMTFGEERDAEWALAIQANADHWTMDGSFEVMIPFTSAVFDERRTAASAVRGELDLATSGDEDAVVLEVLDARLVPDEPISGGAGRSTVHARAMGSRLPDAAFARVWKEQAVAQVAR